MKRDYKKLLKAGNAAQIEKLKENEHKEGFDSIDKSKLFKMLYQEVGELHQAMRKPDNYKEVRREAADVANYAHIIILACDRIMEAEEC